MKVKVFRIVDEHGHWIKLGELVIPHGMGYRPLICHPDAWRAYDDGSGWPQQRHDNGQICSGHSQSIHASQVEWVRTYDLDDLTQIETFLSEPSATLIP